MNPYMHGGTYCKEMDERRALKRRLRQAKRQKKHWNLLDSGRGAEEQGYRFEFEDPIEEEEDEKGLLELVRSHSATSSYMKSVRASVTPKTSPAVVPCVQRRSSEPETMPSSMHSPQEQKERRSSADGATSTYMLALRGPMRPEEHRSSLPVREGLAQAWAERQKRHGARSNFVVATRGPMHPEELRIALPVSDILTQAWSEKQQRNGATISFMTAIRGPMHPEERRPSTAMADLSYVWSQRQQRKGATSSFMAAVRRESLKTLLPVDPAAMDPAASGTNSYRPRAYTPTTASLRRR